MNQYWPKRKDTIPHYPHPCTHEGPLMEYWPDHGGYWVATCRCGAKGDGAETREEAIASFTEAHGGDYISTAQSYSGADRHGHCDGYTFAHQYRRNKNGVAPLTESDPARSTKPDGSGHKELNSAS